MLWQSLEHCRHGKINLATSKLDIARETLHLCLSYPCFVRFGSVHTSLEYLAILNSRLSSYKTNNQTIMSAIVDAEATKLGCEIFMQDRTLRHSLESTHKSSYFHASVGLFQINMIFAM
jgi:hypothetical protein